MVSLTRYSELVSPSSNSTGNSEEPHRGNAARRTPRRTRKSTAQPLAFLLHGSGQV